MILSEIFDKCLNLSLSKRQDYTTNAEIDSHENFKRAAEIASWFKSDDDKPYAVLVGTKLARLAALLDNKTPNHESIDDSFLDLVNYCALWMERRTINFHSAQQDCLYICDTCNCRFTSLAYKSGDKIICPGCFGMINDLRFAERSQPRD